MSAHALTSDSQTLDYPSYHSGHAEDLYIDGYDPVSLAAPHSSLLKTSTWLGFGLILASLAGWGTMIYGLAQYFTGTGTVEHDPVFFIVLGLVLGLGFLLSGLYLAAVVGRRAYFAYRKRTGRRN